MYRYHEGVTHLVQEHYDAIVVGAGPAGSSAALTMAQKGLSVLLLERGKTPGSKVMFGGTIYSRALQEIVPEFWRDAPLERFIVSDSLWLMDVTSAVQMSFTGLDYGRAPFNKFSVLRRNFDPWLAQKAVNAGAELRTSSCVASCVKSGRQVTGVKLATGETIDASVVVLADGVSSTLGRELGMRGTIHPDAVTMYVKEIIQLPPGVIDDRFQLERGEGAIYGMIGYPTSVAVGKGGIWTNRNSLSVVVGTYLDEMIKKRLSPLDLLVRFKQHPLVRRLLAGGKTVGYLSHMIPKGGYKDMPQLYGDGVMIAGDAAVMVSGRHGTDLAMMTGKFAGETAALAKAANDFSRKQLAAYKNKIDNSWFMQDIRAGQVHAGYYSSYPNSDYIISEAANRTAYRFFEESLLSDRERKMYMVQELKNLQPMGKSLMELYQGLMHWRVL